MNHFIIATADDEEEIDKDFEFFRHLFDQLQIFELTRAFEIIPYLVDLAILQQENLLNTNSNKGTGKTETGITMEGYLEKKGQGVILESVSEIKIPFRLRTLMITSL